MSKALNIFCNNRGIFSIALNENDSLQNIAAITLKESTIFHQDRSSEIVCCGQFIDKELEAFFEDSLYNIKKFRIKIPDFGHIEGDVNVTYFCLSGISDNGASFELRFRSDKVDYVGF